MKKGYFIIIIILLAMLVFAQFIPILFDDEKPFVLPEIEDTINLYDASSYAIRDNYVSSIVVNGQVKSYINLNISIEDISSKDIDIKIGDYIYEGNQLLAEKDLEGDYKVSDVIYDSLNDSVNLSLIDLNNLRLEFYIKQENIEQIYLGQEIIYIFNNQRYLAEILLIEPEIINGMVRVFAFMTESPNVLMNGSFVEIEIITRLKEDVLLINKKAVYFVNENAYVDIITKVNNQENLVRTNVILGLENRSYYEILSGLKEGQKVAVYYNEAPIYEFN